MIRGAPITWRERQERREQQRRRERRERQQRRREQRGQQQRQRERRERGQQPRAREQQPRERELLLFYRKQTEKRPAGQRTERSISLGFPLNEVNRSICQTVRARRAADAKILANFFYSASPMPGEVGGDPHFRGPGSPRNTTHTGFPRVLLAGKPGEAGADRPAGAGWGRRRPGRRVVRHS